MISDVFCLFLPACAGMRYKRKRVESREINLNTSGLGGNLDFRCILFVFTCLRGYILRENAGIFAGNYLNTSGLGGNLEFRCILFWQLWAIHRKWPTLAHPDVYSFWILERVHRDGH